MTKNFPFRRNRLFNILINVCNFEFESGFPMVRDDTVFARPALITDAITVLSILNRSGKEKESKSLNV